jgi:hypothetical protein
LHAHGAVRVTLIVHWPGIDDSVCEEIGSVVKQISQEILSVERIVVLPSTQKNSILSTGDEKIAVKRLRELIGEEHFDELYYAHDIEGGTYQFLCTAYPEAKRICFGDGLGNVYEKEVHLSFLRTRAPRSLENIARTMKRRVRRLLVKKSDNDESVKEIVFREFKPDKAALILPVDQSGNFLKRLPMDTCPRDTVMQVIRQCISNSWELQSYVNELLLKYTGRVKFLLLTDNIAEGNFIEFQREIEMYCAIIETNCRNGDVVFLKSHPGESLPRNDRIRERIGGAFEIVALDAKYKRYPIELWEKLITSCRIACMSYPVLSLKYLYGIDVIQPMNDEFIEQWFPKWTWASYKNALSLYMEPLKRLKDWDGKGVLWSENIHSSN